MKPEHSEKLMLATGIAVLCLSVAIPLLRKVANEHDVREVAARAVQLPRQLVSAGSPGKTLSVQVKNIVGGLAPDAAMGQSTAGALGGAAQRDAARPAIADADSAESDSSAVVEWSVADSEEPDAREEPLAREDAKRKTWAWSAK